MQPQIVFDEKKLPDALRPVAKLLRAGHYSVPLSTVESLAPEELKDFAFLTKAEAKNVNLYRAAADRVGIDRIIVQD